MARKKTNTQINTFPEVENSKEVQEVNTSSSSNSAITYTGKIQVTVKKNKRVIFKHQYTNHGSAKLFRFLSSCLIPQNNGLIQAQAPLYIQLFNISDPSYNGSNYIRNDKSVIASPCIIISEATVDATDQAHLGFTIPGSVISQTSIYQAALYSTQFNGEGDNTAIDHIEKYSAAFNFKDASDAWNPIILESAHSADYVLSIDWIMSFTNK